MRDKNKVGFLTKIGCFLIGWDANILRECGEASHRSLKKYISAIIILIAIWGTIGFCFADNYIGIDSLLGKIAVSAVFVAIIICIERYIILTGKLGFMAVVRFFLAFLMAVLGSAIFDQIIFKNDIQVKMKEIRTEQINKEIPKRMHFLDADIVRVTQTIDSLGKANIELYDKLDKRPVIAATDVQTITRQTGVDSNGKPVLEKTTNVTKRNVENPLNGQVKANEEALKTAVKQLEDFQKRKMTVADEVRKEYEEAETGFLEELKALFGILSEDGVALAFYLFLFAFLMSLELLVVTSKSADQHCDYDLIVEHQLKIKSETLKNTENSLLIKGRE